MPLELHQTTQNPRDSLNRKDTRLGLEQFIVDVERQLRQTIVEAKTSINECTPISTLPPELITEIFILACHPEYHATWAGLGEHWEMWPLRLGAVCKAWRELAWSSSQLWSAIFLVGQNRSISGFEDILDSWISRSGNHPLTIHIDAPCLASSCVKSIIDTLIGTAPRWKNVSLNLSKGYFDHFVNHDRFPILEQLSFKFPDHWQKPGPREWNIGESLDIFRSSNMPQIKHLHLPQYVKYFHIWPSALRSLTTFSVDYIYDDQAYHILNFTSHSLQGFIAQYFMSDEHSDTEQHRTLILPTLRRLALGYATGYNIGLNKLLSKIVTPSLKELSSDCDDRQIPSMPDFMSNLSRSLQRLHITCYNDSLEDSRWTINCILKAESLLELHFIGDKQSCKTLVDSLGPAAPKESSSDYLPLLETFTIMGFLPVEGLHWHEMLVYRSSGVFATCIRLKTVRLETHGCFCSWKDMNLLRTALVDSNVEITFAKFDQCCNCASSPDDASSESDDASSEEAQIDDESE